MSEAKMEKLNLVIDRKMLNVSQNEHIEFEQMADSLAEKIFHAEESDVERIIQDSINACVLTNKVKEKIANHNSDSDTLLDYSIDDDFVKTYQEGNVEIEITPIHIVIDKITETEEIDEPGDVVDTEENGEELLAVSNKAATKSKGGRCDKTYYGLGYKLFTVGVGMYFYYNGAKAWYKSDFDAYHKKYIGGALYTVKNWSKKREKSGTSYQGWCSGNFREGLTIKGTGITWFDYYIKHKVVCNKKGTISRPKTVK